LLLLLRHNTYHFRVKVPLDLVDLLHRKELKRSLHTSSKREAKKLVRLRAADTETMFTKLRLGKETMTDSQLKRLSDKLLADFLKTVERPRQNGAELHELMEWPEGYDSNILLPLRSLEFTLSNSKTELQLGIAEKYHASRIATLRKELKLGQWSEETRNTARRLAEDNRLDIAMPSPSWFVPLHQAGSVDLDADECVQLETLTAAERKGIKKFKPAELEVVSTWGEKPPAEFATLCRSVVQTLLEGHEVELERINGNYGTPRQIQVEQRLAQAAKSYTLNDLWNSYRADKTTAGEWAATTAEKYESFVAAVNRTLGDDYDFTVFEDTDHVTALLGKLKAYKSSRTRKIWSAASVNDCVVFLSTLHKYAIRKRKYGITFNPFEARQIAETDAKKREAFTPDELATIWTKLQPLKIKEPDKYWCLLLMLYTGARIGEVCQLRLDDFEKIGEHWVVHYRSRPELGQTIKGERRKKKKRPTDDVDRIAALHPDLRKLGFFRHLESMKEAGELRMFPKETRINNRSGVLMAKKVKTFFKGCFGADTEKSAHYCRHTLISWFKANVNMTHSEASLISCMVGHEDEQLSGGNAVTWGTYGGAHSVKQMYGIMKKLDYGFLALPGQQVEETGLEN